MHIILRVLGWLIVLSIVLSMIFGGINTVINTVNENKRKNKELNTKFIACMRAANNPTVAPAPAPKV